ncbi:MAG: homogentisate 1,2-dioxygenase, partial [Lentimonas sp.]
MPFYHKLGSIPHKRHTIHEKPQGGLYYEQLFGTEGFHGFSSLLYHTHRPTMVKSVSEPVDVAPVAAVGKNITSRMLKGMEVKPENDFLESRKILLFNNDLNVACAAPKESLRAYFYKNADADEVLFVHKGKG